MSEELKNENENEFEKKKLNIYNHNEKKASFKKRNPSIDFIRILSMYAIIIHHIIITGKVIQKYKKYKELKLINILCHWHVSSFALISGIVSYKTFKYSRIA